MRNFTTAVPILAVGIMLLGIAQAQDTPAAKTEPAPKAKTQTAPAATPKKTTGTKAAPAKTPAKTPASAAGKSADAITLKTKKEKFSYALGMNWGTNLRKQSVEVDPSILAQGLRAALAGGKTLLTPEEAQAAITEKRQEQMQAVAEANKKEGDAFLAVNKSKEGVVTLPSGLQYKIMTAGTGPKPTASDSVVCNYRGTLINGTEFDSSYKRGQPATFPVTGVIKGWTEALQLMPVGSKWQLFVPSGLAYGEPGRTGSIGPNTTLIFEVELMSIQENAKTEDKK